MPGPQRPLITGWGLTSFHDEFIVAPSGWKPPDADAASVCRESTQILQDRETFSQSMQAPLTLKVKPMLISTYTFDTNIRWNKIAIYSVRFDVKSTWFDSLLRHFVLFHSTAYPRWWVAFPDGECLNYDVPETTLQIMTILRKACVYRLFTNETSRYDTNPGHRYFCLSCQQLTANQYEFTAHNVDCSRSLSVCQLLESNNNAYLICILLLCPLINMFCMHCRWKCIVYFLKCDVIYSSRKRCAD